MELPKIAWVILALGIVWFVLRLWARRAEQRRQEERDARLAKLLEEREQLLSKDRGEHAHDAEPPSSLGAMTSDPSSEAPKQRRCLGCGTVVNDASTKTCPTCGLEL